MDKDKSYPFAEIEAKWRRIQAEKESTDAPPGEGRNRRRQYLFSWPARGGVSGDPAADGSLWRRLLLADTQSRFQRHRGQETILPLGVDGYSPQAQRAADRQSSSPSTVVDEDRALLADGAPPLGMQPGAEMPATTDPAYYRITQWIFLQLMARGLVYRSRRTVDRCDKCGRLHRHGVFSACARCQGPLEEKEISERRVDISAYGDRLLGDLDGSEKRGGARGRPRSGWPREERILQRECIGRCRGCEVIFPVTKPFELEYHDLSVFTTRVETLYGVMFILIDPYHPALEWILDPACEEDLLRYRERIRRGGEPRISAVLTGGVAINPLTLRKIPILASVLADQAYSHGVVMGVPAHDAEQFELAKRLRLPVREVIHNDKAKLDHNIRLEQPWLGDGVLTNSGPFSGLGRKVARERIVSALSRKGCCLKSTRFRFSSLPISDASTWGPPVPLLYCERCGELPVGEQDLPLAPAREGTVGKRKPRGASARTARAVCPGCGGTAVRDPECLHPWLGTAWSYIRLVCPHLEGDLEGFRALSSGQAGESPGESQDESRDDSAEGSTDEALGDPGPKESAAEHSEESSGPAEALRTEVLPEDVDIFSVPGTSQEVPEEAEVGGDSPEDSPEETPEETAAAAGDEAEADAVVDADADAHADAEGKAEARVENGEPTAPEPAEAPGAATEGKRESHGPYKPKARAGKGGRAEEEDEEIPVRDRLLRLSSLKPFASENLRLIPAFQCFGDASLGTKDIIAMRFIAKFLHDIGQVPSHMAHLCYVRVAPVEGASEGINADSGKMGRTVPELAAGMGADAVRLQVLFSGPTRRRATLEARSVRAMQRFMDRIWRQMKLRRERGKFVSRRMLVHKHRLIYNVTRRLTESKYHTAVAALMEFVRFLEDPETAPEDMDRGAMGTFIILLSPFAPHLARELWSLMGETGDLDQAPWPVASDELIHPPEREFLILVNGRIRDRMVQPSDLEPEKLESRALGREAIREITTGREVRRVVVVPQKLVSIALAPSPEPPS